LHLDKLYIDKIEFIINQISKNGIKIIMISHDDNQILRLANQVFNIKDGAIDEKI
jgi:ABC-type cobalamin transport system ATPase subunit